MASVDWTRLARLSRLWWLGFLGFLGVLSLLGVGPAWLRWCLLCFLFFTLPLLQSGNPRFVCSRVGYGLTPWGFATNLARLGGQLVVLARYRGRPPSPESFDQTVALRPPFDGEWTVASGGVTPTNAPAWELLGRRYAYDFTLVDDRGRTHSADGIWLDDYYAFGEPVLAPAGGTVVAVKDGLPDHPRPGTGWTDWRNWDVRGNHVVVDHGDEYSLLAHLQEGSVVVEPGDPVDVGQQVGCCGNSGNSTEPHLHYQLQDSPSPFTATSLPPAFSGIERHRDGEPARRRWAYLTTGEDVWYVLDEDDWAADDEPARASGRRARTEQLD